MQISISHPTIDALVAVITGGGGLHRYPYDWYVSEWLPNRELFS